MGFTSWLQSLRGRTREGTASPLPSNPRNNNESYISKSWNNNTKRNTPAPEQAQHDTESEVKKSGRRSRGLSLSRPKSQHGNKSRRSWFGGKPDSNEDIPMVPRLVSMHDQEHQQSAGRREVGVTTLPMSSDTTNTRPSMGRTHSRKERESTDGHRELRRKPSWFSSDRKAPVEAMPPLPAVPVSVSASTKPSTSTLPADKRRSRGAASIKSSASSTRSKNKRSSFWASSNPDDSDSDVPPVPSLVRGTSTESSSCNESSDASGDSSRRRTVRKSGAETIRASSRPLSSASRKYVPKSAAKGFLQSTNGASEDTRRSFRKSFSLEDNTDMVCLTDEQRVEWAKLMEKDNKLEDPFESPEDGVETSGKHKFANDQALAALEFGIRS